MKTGLARLKHRIEMELADSSSQAFDFASTIIVANYSVPAS